MALEEVTQLPRLPPRQPDSHKGDFGRVLVVAGSRGMSGAAVLCAGAGLRAGAGLVRLAVVKEILPIVAAANPCYTTAALAQDDAGRIARAAETDILRLAEDNDVVAVGPGLGRSPDLDTLLPILMRQIARPLVLDADALNAFAAQPDKLMGPGQMGPGPPRIVTPHPGELARLARATTAAIQAQRKQTAVDFAAKHQLIVVLKGHQTIVTDGRRLYQNTTGNPGLATGGTGDVLTGVIAALVGQGLEPFAAAQLGVHMHGLAGDLARDELGEIGLVASDLLHYLPRAFRKS